MMSKMMSNMGSMQMRFSSSKMSSSSVSSFSSSSSSSSMMSSNMSSMLGGGSGGMSASNAWNGDARVPLHARHDHRGDALSSFHPSTCLRDPLHCHLPDVTANSQGGSERGLQDALCHRFGHLGPAAVQGGQRLQAGVEHAAVQPRRHHHQAQRQDPDHRGRRPRGAVQAEARDPRQHRPGRHVLLLLLRRSPRDQGSKDEVNSDSPSSLTYRFFSFYITCSHQ